MREAIDGVYHGHQGIMGWRSERRSLEFICTLPWRPHAHAHTYTHPPPLSLCVCVCVCRVCCARAKEDRGEVISMSGVKTPSPGSSGPREHQTSMDSLDKGPVKSTMASLHRTCQLLDRPWGGPSCDPVGSMRPASPDRHIELNGRGKLRRSMYVVVASFE